jgi:hypothetical protein
MGKIKIKKRKIFERQMQNFHLWLFSHDCREMNTESSEHLWGRVTPREHLVKMIQ